MGRHGSFLGRPSTGGSHPELEGAAFITLLRLGPPPRPGVDAAFTRNAPLNLNRRGALRFCRVLRTIIIRVVAAVEVLVVVVIF